MIEELPIREIRFRKIFDSRGNQTVEAEVHTDFSSGVASAPAGASTGATEVKAFPKDGIESGVKFFEQKLKNRLLGFNAYDQRGFDLTIRETDGTEYLENIGGNLSTALSIANARAVANYLGIPLYRYVGGSMCRDLPRPIGNVLGGGKHSVNGTTIQEFLVSSQARTFFESAYLNILVHHRIGKKLAEKFPDFSIGVGDERAWTASISDMEAIDIVKEAAYEVSSENKVKILLGMDFAASSFYKNGKYLYRSGPKTRDEQIDFAVSMSKDHGFYFIEDPMNEDDFQGYAEVTKKVRDRSLVVGDDLYTTNPERIAKGAEMNATNGVLIKVNQIGSLSRTYDAVETARKGGMKNTISHRSGETDDDFIAHLSVVFNSVLIKTGTIGGERLAKINELVRIEQEINEQGY